MDGLRIRQLLEGLQELQWALRETVERARKKNPAALAKVAKDTGGDIIYGIDARVEEMLLSVCSCFSRSGFRKLRRGKESRKPPFGHLSGKRSKTQEAEPPHNLATFMEEVENWLNPLRRPFWVPPAVEEPEPTRFILIAEGVGQEGRRAFPEDTTAENAEFYLIADPIDGTRPLMYDKRSAWSLAAIVPNEWRGLSACEEDSTKGKNSKEESGRRKACPSLRDAVAACMTELSTTKQLYADCLFTVRGQRPTLIRRRLDTGEEREIAYSPSQATTIEHGFAMLTNFFPGGKEMVSAIEEELVRELGGLRADRSVVFTDQYLSTGGQWYELIVGHDRFNGDLRGRMIERGIPPGAAPALAGHPYDCCVELIARQAGVIITDLEGNPFDAPLDTESPMSWLAYANPALRERIEPVMQRLLRKHGLIG